MSAHSPLPWRVNKEFGDYYCLLTDPNGYEICIFDMDNDIDEANLAFIVKAVNNHEKLVEALKEIAQLSPLAAVGAIGGFQIARETATAALSALNEQP